MYLKYRFGWLSAFRPYDDLQRALVHLVGGTVPPAVPWALSFFNGAVVLGFVFARSYDWIPGRGGLAKGLVFGVIGWAAMGLVFFPLLGDGPFATRIGLGAAPAAFSLAMVLAYSITMGIIYTRVMSRRAAS